MAIGKGRRVEVSWHDPQPWKGKLLEVRLVDGEQERAVGLPLPLLRTCFSELHDGLRRRRVHCGVLGKHGVIWTVDAGGSTLSIRESLGAPGDREASLQGDERDALRTTVGHLLLMSEKCVAVAGLLPPYHHATERSPCPICRAEEPPPGLERSCVIAEGLVVCRNVSDGAIASTYGNRVAGHVFVTGEPFSRVVVVEESDA